MPTANSDLFEMMGLPASPQFPFDAHADNPTQYFAVCFPLPSRGGTGEFALRHQLDVLKRSVKQRPKLMPTDRPLWVVLSRVWVTGAQRWLSSNRKPSSPGIAKDFASSGLGKFGAVNRAVQPFPVRSAICSGG